MAKQSKISSQHLLILVLICFFSPLPLWAKINLNTTDGTEKKDDEIYYENVVLPREINRWILEEDSTTSLVTSKDSSRKLIPSQKNAEAATVSRDYEGAAIYLPSDSIHAWFSAGVLAAFIEQGWLPDQIRGEGWSKTLTDLTPSFRGFSSWKVLQKRLQALSEPSRSLWPLSHSITDEWGPEMAYYGEQWHENPSYEKEKVDIAHQQLTFFYLTCGKTLKRPSAHFIEFTASELMQNKFAQSSFSETSNESFQKLSLTQSEEETIESTSMPLKLFTLKVIPESQRNQISSQHLGWAFYAPADLKNGEESFLLGYERARRDWPRLFKKLTEYKLYKGLNSAESAEPEMSANFDHSVWASMELEGEGKYQESLWKEFREGVQQIYGELGCDSSSLSCEDSLFVRLTRWWESPYFQKALWGAQIRLQQEGNKIYWSGVSQTHDRWSWNGGVAGGTYTGALGVLQTRWYRSAASQTELGGKAIVGADLWQGLLYLDNRGMGSPYLNLGAEIKWGRQKRTLDTLAGHLREILWNELHLKADYRSKEGWSALHRLTFHRNEMRSQGMLLDSLWYETPRVPLTGVALQTAYGNSNATFYGERNYQKLLFKFQLRAVAKQGLSEEGAPLTGSVGFELEKNLSLKKGFFVGGGLHFRQDYSVSEALGGNLKNPHFFDQSLFFPVDTALNMAMTEPSYLSFKSLHESDLNHRYFGVHGGTVRVGFDLGIFQSVLSLHSYQGHLSPTNYADTYRNGIEWLNHLLYKSLEVNAFLASDWDRNEKLKWSGGFFVGMPLNFY